jgi:hypothetical protein
MLELSPGPPSQSDFRFACGFQGCECHHSVLCPKMPGVRTLRHNQIQNSVRYGCSKAGCDTRLEPRRALCKTCSVAMRAATGAVTFWSAHWKISSMWTQEVSPLTAGGRSPRVSPVQVSRRQRRFVNTFRVSGFKSTASTRSTQSYAVLCSEPWQSSFPSFLHVAMWTYQASAFWGNSAVQLQDAICLKQIVSSNNKRLIFARASSLTSIAFTSIVALPAIR